MGGNWGLQWDWIRALEQSTRDLYWGLDRGMRTIHDGWDCEAVNALGSGG